MIWILLALSAQAAAPTLLCEDENGATAAAKIVVQAGGGHTLFACGKIEKKKGKTDISAFQVFALGKSGKRLPGHIFLSSDSTVFRVQKKPEVLALDELIPVGKAWVPAFETAISCDEKGCKASKPACVFEAPKSGDKKALARARSFMSGAKKGKLPDEKLIHQLAGLAFAGDKDALAIFHDRGPLRLDGAAGEAYFDHRTMLERLKKAGCLESAKAAEEK